MKKVILSEISIMLAKQWKFNIEKAEHFMNIDFKEMGMLYLDKANDCLDILKSNEDISEYKQVNLSDDCTIAYVTWRR